MEKIKSNLKTIREALRTYPYGVYLKLKDGTRSRIANVKKRGDAFELKTIYGDKIEITEHNIGSLVSIDNGANCKDVFYA